MSLKNHSSKDLHNSCQDINCKQCNNKKKMHMTIEEIKVKIIDFIEKKPDKASMIVTQWIKQNKK